MSFIMVSGSTPLITGRLAKVLQKVSETSFFWRMMGYFRRAMKLRRARPTFESTLTPFPTMLFVSAIVLTEWMFCEVFGCKTTASVKGMAEVCFAKLLPNNK
jgi:hypothetical protein